MNDFAKLLLIIVLAVSSVFAYKTLSKNVKDKAVVSKNNNIIEDVSKASFSPEFAKKIAENKEKNNPENLKKVFKKLVEIQ